MPLEKQVVSLELAKKLKELGVKQESLFYWKYSNGTLERKSGIGGPKTEVIFGKLPVHTTLGTWFACSAFTVAELGEFLPKWSRSYQREEDWEAECRALVPLIHFLGDTEADARANLLIYLIENDLLNK